MRASWRRAGGAATQRTQRARSPHRQLTRSQAARGLHRKRRRRRKGGVARGTAAAAALSSVAVAVAGASTSPASASASVLASAGAGVGARGGAGAAPRSTAHVRESATCLALSAPAATVLPWPSNQKRARGSSKAGVAPCSIGQEHSKAGSVAKHALLTSQPCYRPATALPPPCYSRVRARRGRTARAVTRQGGGARARARRRARGRGRG